MIEDARETSSLESKMPLLTYVSTPTKTTVGPFVSMVNKRHVKTNAGVSVAIEDTYWLGIFDGGTTARWITSASSGELAEALADELNGYVMRFRANPALAEWDTQLGEGCNGVAAYQRLSVMVDGYGIEHFRVSYFVLNNGRRMTRSSATSALNTVGVLAKKIDDEREAEKLKNADLNPPRPQL